MTDNSNTKASRNKFRIIAGHWRGRVLNFAKIDEIRPTTDRVRETLFNWLQFEIVGANCLDLFAGSGALSFEALSRGAATITSLEMSHQASQMIATNMALLKPATSTTPLTLIETNALHWLAQNRPHQPFDIVFLDPPFNTEYLEASCQLLEKYHWLSPNAFIYLESSSSLKCLNLPVNWSLVKEKKAGKVYFGGCRRLINPH